MYQKLILLALLFAAGPLYALEMTTLERAVITATQQQTASWAQKLHSLEKDYRLARASYPPDSFPGQQDVLNYTEEHHYLQRLLTLYSYVGRNPTLKQYRFVAPIPRDLVKLSEPRLATLHEFLMSKQATPKALRRVHRPRPFTLALQLGRGADALEIWIDVPTHKIYLMTDNFYTSAAGKYGLHLF